MAAVLDEQRGARVAKIVEPEPVGQPGAGDGKTEVVGVEVAVPDEPAAGDPTRGPAGESGFSTFPLSSRQCRSTT